MKKSVFRLMALLIGLFLCIAGCANQETEQQTPTDGGVTAAATEATQATQEPTVQDEREVLDVRMMRYAVNLDDVEGIAGDRIKLAVEEMFDIKIEYCTGSTDDYETKLITSMASGEVYDIAEHGASFAGGATWMKWVEQGLLLDLDEYVDADPVKYAALKKVLDDPVHKMYTEVKNGSADKNVCVFPMAGWQQGFYDSYLWNMSYLEAVGMDIPTTWDEFETVLRALNEGDPEGNGVIGDLLPFGYRTYKGTSNTCDFSSLFLCYGLPAAEGFSMVDGEVIDCYTDDIAKECWTRLNGWAIEGLIDIEAVIMDPAYAHWDRFAAGEIAAVAGAFPNTYYNSYYSVMNKVQAVNPDATPDDYQLGPPLQGPDGYPQWQKAVLRPAYATFIPVDSLAADRMVEFLNWLYTTEGQTMLWYGVEGIHYTKSADGEIDLNKEELKKDTADIYFGGADRLQTPMLSMYTTNQDYVDFNAYDTWYEACLNARNLRAERVEKTDTINYINAYLDEWVPQICIRETPAFLNAMSYTETDSLIRTNLDAVFDKYTSKWLTGTATVADTWDDYVAEMQEAGLAAYKARYAAIYNEAKALYEQYID